MMLSINKKKNPLQNSYKKQLESALKWKLELNYHHFLTFSTRLYLVNGFGKIIPSKSPPPPPPHGNSMVPTSRKTDLRVVIPHSKGMMQTLVSVFSFIFKTKTKKPL